MKKNVISENKAFSLWIPFEWAKSASTIIFGELCIWHFKALGGTSDKISSLVVKQAQ